jgi:hypothetical protein
VAARSLAGTVGPLLWGNLYGFFADEATGRHDDSDGTDTRRQHHAHSSSESGSWSNGDDGSPSTKHVSVWAVGPRDVFWLSSILALLSMLVACTIPSASTSALEEKERLDEKERWASDGPEGGKSLEGLEEPLMNKIQ